MNPSLRCLQNIPDELLLCYMLQLVQALKHEMFLQCDLVEFLLERALSHQHVGHYLFWHLKAEMKVVGLTAGLILEAYLSAAPEHVIGLESQNYLLDRCNNIHLAVMKRWEMMKDKNHEKLKVRKNCGIGLK